MKFKDAELIGVPTIVVVGKGLVDGVVEVKDRASGEREDVALADAVEPRRRRRRASRSRPHRISRAEPRDGRPDIEAVIFDWGGTLTPVAHRRLRRGGAGAGGRGRSTRTTAAHERLARAGDAVWGRSRDHHTSATVADIFLEAGLAHDESLLTAYRDFWEPHTYTDPDVLPLFSRLRVDGIKVGVLSNTVWPRAWHEDFFRRDGVLDLLDGAVYTSEIPWTKPAPAGVPRRDGGGRRRRTRRPACSSATGSSTTSGAPRTPACAPSTSRTATSRARRSGTPRASRTRSPSSCGTCTTWCRPGASAG